MYYVCACARVYIIYIYIHIYIYIYIYIYIHTYIPYHTIPYHYIPLHTFTYHYIPLHTITYHYIPLHTIRYHYIPLHNITLHYNTYIHTYIYIYIYIYICKSLFICIYIYIYTCMCYIGSVSIILVSTKPPLLGFPPAAKGSPTTWTGRLGCVPCVRTGALNGEWMVIIIFVLFIWDHHLSSFIHNLSYIILSKIFGIKVGTECTVTSVGMAGVGATTSLEGHGWVVDSVDVSGCPLYLAAIPYVEAQWREPKHRILPNDFGKDGDVAWYLAADTAEASQHSSRSRHGEPRDQRLGFDPSLFPSFKKGMRIMRMSLSGVSPELKCHMIHWDSASGIR